MYIDNKMYTMTTIKELTYQKAKDKHVKYTKLLRSVLLCTLFAFAKFSVSADYFYNGGEKLLLFKNW